MLITFRHVWYISENNGGSVSISEITNKQTNKNIRNLTWLIRRGNWRDLCGSGHSCRTMMGYEDGVSVLWLIDSYQNKISADKYTVTISRLNFALSSYYTKTSSVILIFLLSNCDWHDKMQRFAKFKNKSVSWVQNHLKFSKIVWLLKMWSFGGLFSCCNQLS